MTGHDEPTIPVRASVAFAWADATKRNTGRRAIVNALLDDIEAHRPPPPMPDIEWQAGTRVQRRGVDGHGAGPVFICRPGVGLLVDIVNGRDEAATITCKDRHDPTGLYLGPIHLLRGSEWRLASPAPAPAPAERCLDCDHNRFTLCPDCARCSTDCHCQAAS